MDIKHLYTRENGEVFAAELLDGTESYPVFLESLGNTVILPGLLDSGWTLTALPLTLRKNGVDLMQYPKQVLRPTMDQEQEMYDLMGEEMSMADRAKLVSVDTNNAASFRQASSYIINTREEFISYLTGLRLHGVKDSDYAPLNCFVSPAARFSIAEFLAPENATYRDIINSRRRFNPSRFRNLLKFLGLQGAGWSPFELAKAYFQWGIDGIAVTLSEPTSLPLYERYGGRGDPSIKRITERTFVVAKRDGTMLTAGIDPQLLREQSEIRMFSEDQGGPKRITFSESESGQLGNLKNNDQGVVLTRFSYSKQDALVYQVLDANAGARRITLTQESIIIDTNPIPLFMVSDGNSAVAINDIANPAQATQNSYLRALARAFHDKRKTQFEATTYRALLSSGCSPLSALNHARFYFGWNVPGNITDENDVPLPAADSNSVIMFPELISFVKGDMTAVPEIHRDLLQDFVYGSLNYDALQNAITAENNDNVDSTYKVLWAAHNCLHVPVDELREIIMNWTSGPLVIKGEGAYLSIPDIKINGASVAYHKFLSDVRNEQAKDPQVYLWVDAVLEALGDGSEDRHVGALVSVMPRTNKVIEALDWIRIRYIDMVLDAAGKIRDTTSDLLRYNQLCYRFLGPAPYEHIDRADPSCRYMHTEGCIQYVIAQALFSGLRTGIVKLPIPGQAQALTVDVKNGTPGFENWKEKFDGWAAEKFINPELGPQESYYISTNELCDGALSPYENYWNFYCCNASISLDKITPRKHFELKSVALSTAVRFADVNNHEIPGVKAYWDPFRPLLMQNMDFMFYLMKNPIEKLPATRRLTAIVDMPTGVGPTLLSYFNNCKEAARQWAKEGNGLRVAGFTHPMDVCYPCVDVEEDEDYDPSFYAHGTEPLRGDERGLPGFTDRIGFKDVPYADETALPPKVIPPVRRFTGLTVEDFQMGGGQVDYPPTSGYTGMVIIRHGNIAVHDGNKVSFINPSDVERLDQSLYPVRHLCGNRYLVRDQRKDLWVVEV